MKIQYIEEIKKSIEEANLVVVGLGEEWNVSPDTQSSSIYQTVMSDLKAHPEYQWLLPYFYYKWTDDKLQQAYKNLFDLLKDKFRNEQQENFIILFLNSKNDLINFNVLFKGSVSSNNIHPRDIFREAMKHNANRIIICHNHPSGDPSPSDSDIITTKSLIDISRFIAIPIIDHIILGDQTYFSFKENKII